MSSSAKRSAPRLARFLALSVVLADGVLAEDVLVAVVLADIAWVRPVIKHYRWRQTLEV
jgi:hypothetical protein